MRKLFICLLLCGSFFFSFGQLNLDFLNRRTIFGFGGGMVFPGEDMAATSSKGLYARSGYQVFFDLNFIIKYGLGFGFNYEYDEFRINKGAYTSAAQAESMSIVGNYSSGKFGLNVLMNLPVIVDAESFSLNFYGEINAGLRGFNIPEIDLYYDQNINKYVEVHYRARKNTFGYVGYSGGFQLLFENRWGINLSYNALFRSRHTVKYSARCFDAFDQLYEYENYLNNYLDHYGLQLGIVILSLSKRQITGF